jgi:hypothetical protein
MTLSNGMILGIAFYAVLLFLAIPLFWTRFRRFYAGGYFLRTGLFIKSLSLREILLLSFSANDRVGFIKDYYDFRHKNISSMIKGLSSVILLNSGVLIKNHFEAKATTVMYNSNEFILIILTIVLITINVRYFIKLNDCVRDFKKAVRFYEFLK